MMRGAEGEKKGEKITCFGFVLRKIREEEEH